MRVLLIDEHALFRHGIRLILADLDPPTEILEADTVASAEADHDGPIELILLDLRRPGLRGIEPIASAFQAYPEAKIVVVSGNEDPAVAVAAIEAGAAGFIPKAATAAVLLSALRLVLVGGVYLPRHVLEFRRQASGLPHAGHGPSLLAPKPLASIWAGGFEITSEPSRSAPESVARLLTPRQRQVLRRIVQGMSNKTIARDLQVSESTIKQHLSAMFKLLGVANRAQAVFLAAQLKLQDDPDQDGPST